MISLNFTPSLEQASQNRLAISVCSQSDIRNSLPPSNATGDRSEVLRKWFVKNQALINSKLEDLSIPESRKKDLLDTIYEICREIFDWKCTNRDNNKIFNFLMENFHFVSWTDLGEIDTVKSVYNVLKNMNNDFTDNFRYEAACAYSFHDIIYKLRPQVISSCTCVQYTTDDWQQAILRSYWENKWDLDRDRASFDIVCLLTSAASLGNLSAVEYILELPAAKANSALLTKAVDRLIGDMHSSYKRAYKTHVLSFLLSRLKPDQQKEMFEKHAPQIFHLFLSWPLLPFLPTVIQHFSPYLSPERVYQALCIISSTATSREHRATAFSSVWENSSSEAKDHVMQYVLKNNDLLPFLLNNNDESNIDLLRSYATEEQKEKIERVIRYYYLNPWRIDKRYGSLKL